MLVIAGGILIAVAVLMVLAVLGIAIAALWDELSPFLVLAFVVAVPWAAFRLLGPLLGWVFVLFVVGCVAAGILEAHKRRA